jgi:UDP-N-acetylmuramoyl-tripeptide--D-alanyl-D-alanine ligase
LLAAALDGRLQPSGAARRLAHGLAVDSRQLMRGQVFVALAGKRADGHAFVAEAAARGAAAAVVSRQPSPPVELPLIWVRDGASALRAFARHQLRRYPVPVVGITGSAGKTTTKELAAAALAGVAPVLRNAGNLNTAVGLPIALFALGPQHRWAVLEYGTSAPGELADLCTVVPPAVAVVTLVDWAHSAFLGDLDGIAHEKRALVEALPPTGTAVLNADDQRVRAMARAAPRSLLYGLAPDAQVRAERVEHAGIEGSAFTVCWPDRRRSVVRLRLPGAHNVLNALAAAAVAWVLQVPAEACVAGLESLKAPPQRLQSRPGRNGVVLLDDAYNANPASVRAALAVLAASGGRRVAVLGAMRELGKVAPRRTRRWGDWQG